MATATGSTRITTVDLRLVLTQLKAQKPQYAPYLAAIQAASNEFIGPMGFLAYGIANGHLGEDVVNLYLQRAKPEFDSKIALLGVTVQLSASPTPGGLSISWAASKTGASDSGSYTIAGLTEDFSDDWIDSLTIAANRWSRFANSLTADMADKILNAAQVGYEQFMTEGTPTAKQIMAALKHKIRLLAVDRTYYVNRVREAVQRYQAGYQAGKTAYATAFKYVGDALAAATRLSVSIFRVL